MVVPGWNPVRLAKAKGTTEVEAPVSNKYTSPEMVHVKRMTDVEGECCVAFAFRTSTLGVCPCQKSEGGAYCTERTCSSVPIRWL